MVAKRTLGILFSALIVGSLPAVSEASFARRIGSSYGGTLSSNTSLSTQQLTADPVTVLKGSTSTEYDPSVVKLNNITAEPGFTITEAYVGVRFEGEEGEDLVSLNQFLEGLEMNFVETGYLQVFYKRTEGEGGFETLATSEGYVVVDQDGEVNGDNTHTMTFDYLAEDPKTVAKYRLYADDGSRGTSADSLVSIEDPTFRIHDIAEANVAGPLVVPLPAAFGPGLIGLVGVAMHGIRRRRLAKVA
jgi:hypothetical protein